MTQKQTGALLALSLLCASISLAQTNLLSNPGFESPDLGPPPGSWSSTVPGWQMLGTGGITWGPFDIVPQPTEGQQIFWGANTDFHIYQPGAAVVAPDMLYTLKADIYPLTDPQTNCYAQVVLEGVGVMMAEAWFHPPGENYEYTNWAPCPDCHREDFALTPGQWTTVTVRFNGSSFANALVPFGNQNGVPIQARIHGMNIAVDNVSLTASPKAAAARDRYVSQSQGNDTNDGLSPQTAWKTFQNIRGRLLAPGDRVLLRRGDLWTEELYLTGKGTAAQPVELTAYGMGAPPRIRGTRMEYDRCVVWDGPSHVRINQLDLRHAKLGLYLRYVGDYNNTDVEIRDCYFEEFTTREDGIFTGQPLMHGGEYAFNAAIYVGGRVLIADYGNPTPNQDDPYTVLDGLTVDGCAMVDCSMGFGTNWFWYTDPRVSSDPTPLPRHRIRNLNISDTYATGASAGGLDLHLVDGGLIRGFRCLEPVTRSYPAGFWWGSTGIIVESCENLVFEDCEFSEEPRLWPDYSRGDGTGVDLEGNNANLLFQDSVFDNNDAAGLMFLSTFGSNSGIAIQDCTFYNNGVDGGYYVGGQGFELRAGNGALTNPLSSLTNCGFYISDPALPSKQACSAFVPETCLPDLSNYHLCTDYCSYGWMLFQQSSDSAFVAPSQLRYGWYAGYPAAPTVMPMYPDLMKNESVGNRPHAWSFDTPGNAEGWNDFHDCTYTVADGNLKMTLSSNNPWVKTGPAWINSHRQRFLHMRMRSSGGTTAMLWFITETNPNWLTPGNVVSFPLINSGEFQDYVIDMRQNPLYRGVITQIQLQPSNATGTLVELDILEFLDGTRIPNLAGLSESAATQMLSLAGLTAEIHYAYDETTPAGNVLAQESPAGTTWCSTQPVSLWVSLGTAALATGYDCIPCQPASDAPVPSGEAVCLIAPDTTAPGATYLWYREDGHPLDLARFSDPQCRYLSSEKVRTQDAGVYHCVYPNETGIPTVYTVTLEVLPPKMPVAGQGVWMALATAIAALGICSIARKNRRKLADE